MFAYLYGQVLKSDCMLRGLALGISLLFHPLLVPSYALALLLLVNPYQFGVPKLSEQFPLMLLVFFSTFGIPAFGVLMMRLLGFVKTMQLEENTERIGPYILTAVFYLWLFINFLNNSQIPVIYTSFMLGATIGLFLAFFINNFSKISAHAVGMGGMTAFLLILMFVYRYDMMELGSGNVPLKYVLLLLLLISGLVGTSRLLLKAHTLQDLYGGFLVGLASQFIALRFLF